MMGSERADGRWFLRLVLSGVVFSLVPVSAFAAYPPSVEGGLHALVNTSANAGLVVLQQAETADPADCERITGTWKQNSGKVIPLAGGYCPGTGRLTLAVGKVASQLWIAQAGAPGPTLTFSGTASILGGPAGQLAEVPLLLFPPPE